MKHERPSAYEAGLRLLARREHARRELALKLQQRSYPAAEIEQALDDLVARGYLSEARFAEAFARERAARGYGERRVRGELRDRGVGDACIGAALAAIDTDWDAVLQRVYRSRFPGEPPHSRRDWERRAGFLQARGFDSDQIRRLLGAW